MISKIAQMAPRRVPVSAASTESARGPVPESATSTQSTAEPTPSPANDRFPGLISGEAPPVSAEMPPEPELTPIEAVPEGDEKRLFKRLDLVSNARSDQSSRYLDYDNDNNTVTINPIMDEKKFVEFWAVDVWEVIAAIARSFGVDLSDIRTDDHEIEEAEKAAMRLYRMAQKHPKMLGWMISEKTLDGGDFILMITFFGGKFAVIGRKVMDSRKAKKQSAQSAKSTREVADV